MAGPLSGKKILVTRSKDQAKSFSKKLSRAGAVPLIAPLLSFEPRVSLQNKITLEKLHDYTWVFFTSANGVKFFFEQLDHWGINKSVLHPLKIAVVGRKTEKILHQYGFEADFHPTKFQGSQMIQEFLLQFSEDQRILLVCGNLARKEVADELEKQHVFFRKAIVYDTLINKETKPLLVTYLKDEEINVLTFTSPSTIQAFIKMVKDTPVDLERMKRDCLCLCIGATTKKKAAQQGFKNIRIPAEFTVDGMLKELVCYYNLKG